ncbi:hypothetical protein Ga0100231_021565 [Opitutaceae bacterium TAV4]|nr:hypothetical protein Ga0100231_021565 [Opitutaceae bacterium TAV4]RRJ99789.1 hypothetical protein Ga0100230_017185 [Opitutaceae bacterium TAV3]
MTVRIPKLFFSSVILSFAATTCSGIAATALDDALNDADGAATATESAATAKSEQIVFTTSEDYIPVKGPRRVKKGGIFDFSTKPWIFDAPAGKHGFIRAVGEHFEFENRPGKPVRFNGLNLMDVPSADSALVESDADAMAEAGYNLLRLHHFDDWIADYKASDPKRYHSGELDPVNLDRLDRIVAACKKRGIYTTLDFYTIRRIRRAHFPDYPGTTDEKFNRLEYKALVWVDERTADDFWAFAENLMNHVNPYTGLAWKDDPAIVFISLINEGPMTKLPGVTPTVQAMFDRKFDEWAAKRGYENTPELRKERHRQFITEFYNETYARFVRSARDIGIRVPLTDQNLDTLRYETILQRRQFDYIDLHAYGWHPTSLDKNFRWHENKAALKVGAVSTIKAYYSGGPMSILASGRHYGKPFVVSEWEYCMPAESAQEGTLLMASYAAAQNWNGLVRFGLGHGFSRGNFETVKPRAILAIANPQTALAERMTSLLFLRGDVRPSVDNYPILMPLDYAEELKAEKVWPENLRRIGLLGRTGILFFDPKKPEAVASMLPPNTKGVFQIGSTPVVTNGVPVYTDTTVRLGLNLPRNPAVNDTGELTLDRDLGVFSVVTPRSEGFAVPEGQEVKGAFATAKSKKSFATVFVSAMDEKPLSTSESYLILHLTGSKGEGMRFRNDELAILDEWGNAPLLAHRGEVEFTFNRNFPEEGFVLYALSFSGERLFRVAMETQNGRSRFTAKNTSDGHVIAAYELAR